MNKVLFSSKSDEWSTPQNLFDKLFRLFNFTLDPCATYENHKLPKYYTIEDDGLIQNWDNEVVFCNPPYSQISRWVDKCFESYEKCPLICLLIPSRTDTKYFQKMLKSRYCNIYFLPGRLKFSNSKNSASFPSCLCFFSKSLFLLMVIDFYFKMGFFEK